MAKTKKKTTPLTSYQKALATALNMQRNSPNEARDAFKTLRIAYKHLASKLDITDTLMTTPTKTPDNEEAYDRIFRETGDFAQNAKYLEAIRILALGMWAQDKRVYSLSDGMSNYIRNQISIETCNMNLTKAYSLLCDRPIYIEFSEGPILGAFCAMTTLHPLKTDAPMLFCVVLMRDEDGSQAYCHCCDDLTINDVLKQTSDMHESLENKNNADESFIVPLHMALAYISYCTIANDSDAAITPIAKQGATVYSVHPVEGIPDSKLLFDPEGWLGRGICESFGCLTRNGMLNNLEKALKKYHAENGNLRLDIRKVNDDEDGIAKVNAMAYEWEHNRFVYQFTHRSDDAFRDKYLDRLCLEGFPEELFRYFPYSTIALHEKTNNQVTLASPCRYIRESGAPEPALAIVELGYNVGLTILPISAGGIAEMRNESLDWTIRTVCALYHILTSLRGIAQKRLTEDFATRGNPASEAMATTQERKAHSAREAKETSNVRYTAPLDMPELNIFDVSLKVFKRAPKSTTERYMKWHMAPHTRRRHPHRYWVGKGAERHLEIRWLEPMRINASDEDEHTTICKLPET